MVDRKCHPPIGRQLSRAGGKKHGSQVKARGTEDGHSQLLRIRRGCRCHQTGWKSVRIRERDDPSADLSSQTPGTERTGRSPPGELIAGLGIPPLVILTEKTRAWSAVSVFTRKNNFGPLPPAPSRRNPGFAAVADLGYTSPLTIGDVWQPHRWVFGDRMAARSMEALSGFCFSFCDDSC